MSHKRPEEEVRQLFYETIQSVSYQSVYAAQRQFATDDLYTSFMDINLISPCLDFTIADMFLL